MAHAPRPTARPPASRRAPRVVALGARTLVVVVIEAAVAEETVKVPGPDPDALVRQARVAVPAQARLRTPGRPLRARTAPALGVTP